MGHTVPAVQSTFPRFSSDAWNRNPLTVAMAGTVAITGAHKVTLLGGADSLHAFGVNFENLLSIKALASPRKCRVICGTVFFWNASLTSIARLSSVTGSASVINASSTIIPQLMAAKSDWQ